MWLAAPNIVSFLSSNQILQVGLCWQATLDSFHDEILRARTEIITYHSALSIADQQGFSPQGVDSIWRH
jgi:hypothetical protein